MVSLIFRLGTEIVLRFLLCVLFFVCALVCNGKSSVAKDEIEDRVEAGKRFLTDARVNQWENYFSEGLSKMGKIVLSADGELIKESWLDKKHVLIKHHQSDKLTIIMCNPKYIAMVAGRDGKYETVHVDKTEFELGYVYVDAIPPIAVCSSVNFTREIVPRYLQSGKLAISDYRYESQKHHVELEFVDEPDRGKIGLIFNEDNPSVLPNESIHNKGTPDSRHFVSKNFVEIEGYHVPTELGLKNSNGGSAVELLPQERLNQEMCYLSYYGLPEPGEVAATDFGSNSMSWRTIVFGLLVGFAFALTLVLWFRRKS